MEAFKTHVRVFMLYTVLLYMAHSRSEVPTTASQYNVFLPPLSIYSKPKKDDCKNRNIKTFLSTYL